MGNNRPFFVFINRFLPQSVFARKKRIKSFVDLPYQRYCTHTGHVDDASSHPSEYQFHSTNRGKGNGC
jgi:hypothetical protein